MTRLAVVTSAIGLPADNWWTTDGVVWAAITVLAAGGVGGGSVAGVATLAWTSAVIIAVLLVRLRCGTFATPVLLPVAVLLGVGLAGEWSNGRPGIRTGVSYYAFMPAAQSSKTFGLMCFVAVMLAGGALLTLPGGRRAHTARHISFSPLRAGWLYLLCWVPALVTIGTVGLPTLLHRDTYLVGSQGGIHSLSGALSTAAVVLFGYLFADSHGPRRLTTALGTLVLILIYLSLGSRTLALLPLLFATGFALQRRGRRSFVYLLLALVASVWLIRVPLYLRAGTSHGFVPYFGELWPALAAHQSGIPAINNIVAGFPIIGATAFTQPPIPHSWLRAELNPAPGGFAGYYGISGSLRLNQFTPYSAIGELGNYGFAVTIAVCAYIGALLGYFERRIRTLVEDGHSVFVVIYFGLSALFSVKVLQYDLRSSLRLLYYVLTLDIVILVVFSLQHRRNQDAPRQKAVQRLAMSPTRQH